MSDEKKTELPQTEAVYGKSQIFPKLEALPCWNECISLIEMGNKPTRIAKFIQEERRECLDMTQEALRVGIHRWIQKNLKKFVSDQVPSSAAHITESLDYKNDPRLAIQALFNIQFERVMIDFRVEAGIGKCISQNNTAIKVANDLIKTMKEVDAGFAASGRTGNPATDSALDKLEQVERVRKQYAAKYGSSAAAVLMSEKDRTAVMQTIELIRSTAKASPNNPTVPTFEVPPDGAQDDRNQPT